MPDPAGAVAEPTTRYPKVYIGEPPFGADAITVEVEPERGYILEHHVRHSPTGFAWGYEGSGPAETALNVLWDFFKHEPPQELYQAFKRQVIARFPMSKGWRLTADEVMRWLSERAEAEAVSDG